MGFSGAGGGGGASDSGGSASVCHQMRPQKSSWSTSFSPGFCVAV